MDGTPVRNRNWLTEEGLNSKSSPTIFFLFINTCRKVKVMKKEDYLIDLDLSNKDDEYYMMFRNPKNRIIRIDNIDKIQLKRVSPDAVELKIINSKNKTYLYHYVNEIITLLDDLELGIE